MRILDKNRSVSSPGGPIPKATFITVVKVEDIVQAPQPNSKGVLHEGLFQMKPGKEPLSLYNTGSFQVFGFESDGDEDAAAIQKTLTARFPGDSLEIREYIHESTDVEVIVLFGGKCNGSTRTILGSTCNPIKMRANYTQDNDGTYYELTFTNMSNDNIVPGLYDGPDPVATAFESATVSLALTVANGPLVKLPSSATGEAVGITSFDFEAGQFISILGGGGADPAVISDGTGTAAKFLLKDGTSFIGLDGARITFEVFVAGTDTFLIERNRA